MLVVMRGETVGWMLAVVACGPTIDATDEMATTTGALGPPSTPGSTSTSTVTSVSTATSGSTSELESTSSFETTSTAPPMTSSESGTGSSGGFDLQACGAGGGDGGTGGGEECFGKIQLQDVEMEIATNRIMGEDIAAAFDPDQGSVACLRLDDGWARLYLQLAPFDWGGACTTINVDIGDGARLYDLATDPGPPGTGQRGLLGVGNAYQASGTTTLSYSTINQAGVGSVDVVSLPVDGETTLELAAQGAIVTPDGWEFDFHITATVP
jgi:hypothetical protein